MQAEVPVGRVATQVEAKRILVRAETTAAQVRVAMPMVAELARMEQRTIPLTVP